MNTEFLIPFIALLVCFGWISSANTQCERNYDYVHFYNTGLFQMVILAIAACVVAGLIISWVNAGFLFFLAYFGIAIATIFISRFTTSPILVSIFGYQGITGIILPILCAIASAIWMFCKAGSF